MPDRLEGREEEPALVKRAGKGLLSFRFSEGDFQKISPPLPYRKDGMRKQNWP